MSFFFAKRDKDRLTKPQRAGPPSRTSTAALQIGTLHRLGCRACPLDKATCSTPRMDPTLAEGGIYFLGLAPNKVDDTVNGRPLTGAAGGLLRECLPGGRHLDCSYDNLINCRPPDDRAPTWVEVEACRPRHVDAIEVAAPKLIIGLGAEALQWALGTLDMIGLRGRIFTIKVGNHVCYFMPTYHPDFVKKYAREPTRPLSSPFGMCLKLDIKRAFAALDSLPPPPWEPEADVAKGVTIYDGKHPNDFAAVIKCITDAETFNEVCIDLETLRLRPYQDGAKVLTAALSYGASNVAFGLDHPQCGFSSQQKQHIRKSLTRLMKSKTVKIAHNVGFEAEWISIDLGRDAIVHKTWRCTMAQAHFIDERRGSYRDKDDGPSRYQSLGFLVKQYFGFDPKPKFKLNKNAMDKEPIRDVLTYNGADTKYTLRLYQWQLALIEAAERYEFYELSHAYQPTVALMQTIGVCVNHAEVKASQNKIDPEIKRHELAIATHPDVLSYIKKYREFNPASPKDLIRLFKDHLKFKQVNVKDKKGNDKESVDKAVMDSIDHPLANHIVELRHLSKFKSTYVDGLEQGKGELIYPDGRLHTSFNTTTTETSRLSSDGPNLQNYPKRADAWVRKLVVPPPGHVFIAIDYGQLEACTGAMCSKDKFLTKALWEDYDIHAEWSRRTALMYPAFVGGKKGLDDKDTMKKFRALIKNKLVFPAFFGASPQSVRSYLVNATGVDVDQRIIDKLFDNFWSYFNGVANWQDRTMRRYYNEGMVESLHGRRRYYPLTRNQAINHPIQGTAAGLVCDAMCRMSELSIEQNIPHLHPVLNVHDDLTYMVPDDDRIIEDSINTIMEQMLCFDFPWINVPMSIEVSIGSNWCELQEVGKFWSHKEFGYPNTAQGA